MIELITRYLSTGIQWLIKAVNVIDLTDIHAITNGDLSVMYTGNKSNLYTRDRTCLIRDDWSLLKIYTEVSDHDYKVMIDQTCTSDWSIGYTAIEQSTAMVTGWSNVYTGVWSRLYTDDWLSLYTN